MDRVGADFYRCVEMIVDRLNATPLVLQLPIGAEGDFTGVIDLVEHEGARLARRDQPRARCTTTEEIPADLVEKAAEYRRRRLLEAVAEADDDADGEVPRGRRSRHGRPRSRPAIRQLTIGGKINPVLCGSAFKNKGVQPMLDAVVDYLPSPLDVAADRGPRGGQPRRDHRPSAERDRAVLRAGVQDRERPVLRQADLRPGLLGPRSRPAPPCSTPPRARRSASARSTRCTPTSVRRSTAWAPATSSRSWA